MLRNWALPAALWALVAVYAAGIFYLSSAPIQEQPPEARGIHDAVNETVTTVGGEGAARHTPDVEHFFLYLGFGLSVAAASAASAPRGSRWARGRATLALSIVIIFLYAASDELHQSLVPAREASVWDLLLDTLGGGIGACAMVLTIEAQRRRNNQGRSPEAN